jgi:hypothetical protein
VTSYASAQGAGQLLLPHKSCSKLPDRSMLANNREVDLTDSVWPTSSTYTCLLERRLHGCRMLTG